MSNIMKSNQGMDPWRDFFSVDNFFDNNWGRRGNNKLPAVNISENDKNYSLEVVAPGFEKGDFKLKVEDDVSKSENTENDKGKEYTRREYSYNSFTRSFQLPDNVNDENISANYKDGVLNIELPKSKQEVKASKEIQIS